MVAYPFIKPLDSVWLDTNGRTVVHKDWDDLDIILLEGEPRGGMLPKERKVPPGGWSAEEVETLNRLWDQPLAKTADYMGRTVKSVSSKRRQLRSKGYPKVEVKA